MRTILIVAAASVALVALAALAGCGTATTVLIMSADEALRMCQADPATALAIAEQYDHLTRLDGPSIVEWFCGTEPVS
jgi:hypothetical protein